MTTPKKPGTVSEALSQMKAAPLSAEEAAELGAPSEPTMLPPEAEQPELPDWVVLPPGFKFPAGRVVTFIRFRGEWTDSPGKGDRHCILWNLTVADEKQAIARARGDAMRLTSELAKQMVRTVDGKKANWAGDGKGGSVDLFWDELGARCRQILVNHFAKTHSLTEAERADFFENCIAVRTAG